LHRTINSAKDERRINSWRAGHAHCTRRGFAHACGCCLRQASRTLSAGQLSSPPVKMVMGHGRADEHWTVTTGAEAGAGRDRRAFAALRGLPANMRGATSHPLTWREHLPFGSSNVARLRTTATVLALFLALSNAFQQALAAPTGHVVGCCRRR